MPRLIGENQNEMDNVNKIEGENTEGGRKSEKEMSGCILQ